MGRTDSSIVFLRALATVLVVVGHATRSLQFPNNHMAAPLFVPFWETVVRNHIYSYHMPLFFWISGYVFYLSTEGRPSGVVSDILKKIRRLIVPMYAASFMFLLPFVMLFGHVNRPLGVAIRLLFLGIDNDHLWFLKTLFLIFAVMIPVSHLKVSRHWLSDILLVAVWLGLYRFLADLPGIFYFPVKYFPFFFAGCLSWKYGKDWIGKAGFKTGAIFFLAHMFLFIRYGNPPPSGPGFGVLWYGTASFGTAFWVIVSGCVARSIRSRGIWTWVEAVETRSFSLYLFHVAVLYVALDFCLRFQVESAVLRLLISLVPGFAVPVLLHDLFARIRPLAFAFSIPYIKKPQIREG